MKKQGFTLIELLGVILLLGMLMIIVYPTVTNIFEKKQKEIDSAKLKIIYSGVESYMNKDLNTYTKEIGKTYCISLDTVDRENLFAVDISDIELRYDKVTMGANNTVMHNLVNSCE